MLPELEPALRGDGDVDRELLDEVDGPISLEGAAIPGRRRLPVVILDPILEEEGDCGGVRTEPP